MTGSHISVQLSHDAALVLFDWLARRREEDIIRNPDDEELGPEEKALGILEGSLEKSLVEVFSTNYDELVADAKIRLAKN